MFAKPKNLKPGDSIAVISTARKIDVAQIPSIEKVLNDWGYQVKWGSSIKKEHHQFCGTDAERAVDLQWALDDPDIKAILCFRGGYGTIRILDQIDFSTFCQHPKWVVGYSDVTALHGAIHRQGIMSVHGTMPVNFSSNTQAALETLQLVLSNGTVSHQANAHPLNRVGEAKGELVGGNLSMIYSMTSTPFDFDFTDKILFLEDLDEYLYHVDRMMQNLKLRGVLAKLKGLVVGGLTDMNDNQVPFGKNAEEIIAEVTSEYDYPVCFDFPAGHLDDNRALILGMETTLSVQKDGVKLLQG